jgi:hypothetical protein
MRNQQVHVIQPKRYRLRALRNGLKEARLTFDCPACGKKHTAREVYRAANFDKPGYHLPCGADITLLMPWFFVRRLPPIAVFDRSGNVKFWC